MVARLCRLTLTMNIALGTEKAQMTSHWFSPSGLSEDTLAALLIPLLDDWWTDQRTLHTAAVTFTRAQVQTINISNGHVISGQELSTAATAGNRTGSNTLPAECSLCLSLRTPFTGGSFRGRMYLPPLAWDALDTAGNVVDSQRDACASNWATLLTDVIAGTGDWEPVVYSRKEDGATPIIAVQAGNIMDVQRRRRRSLVERRHTVSV